MIIKLKKEVYTFLNEDSEIETKDYEEKEFFNMVLDLLEKEIEIIKEI